MDCRVFTFIRPCLFVMLRFVCVCAASIFVPFLENWPFIPTSIVRLCLRANISPTMNAMRINIDFITLR